MFLCRENAHKKSDQRCKPFTKEELQYVNNRSSLDFMIYRKIVKSCVLAIEVDGFEYYEYSPNQLNRDRLKNSTLQK